MSQFKLVPWVMEAPRRDQKKALLKASGVIKVRWCGDESEHSAPLWFPANVTLFQTRRVVWLLLLTGLKETREHTRVELMHAIAKKKIGGLYATSLFSVVQTQQKFICVHPKVTEPASKYHSPDLIRHQK